MRRPIWTAVLLAVGFCCMTSGMAMTQDDLLEEILQSHPGLQAVLEQATNYRLQVVLGLVRVLPKKTIRIYNKTGQAYAFSIENAWVVDNSTGNGFFLAATLYTNANGILNDDDYEYEEIVQPFMADLGEAVARQLWVLQKD